jgi:CheY-like chemotaxis protein
MPSGNKADLFLRKIAELSEFAKRGDDFFSDEVCNFITDEFNLDAAVLFLINNDKSLTVLSRSSSSRKVFTKGSTHQCPQCKSIQGEVSNDFYSDASCQLKISDFLLNETCINIRINKENSLLIKIAKKSAFTRDEKENLSRTLTTISNFYNTWYSIKSGSLPGNQSFIQLYSGVSQELKNSVNSIIGFTTIISEENLSSSNAEYISSIKRNAQNLLLNINDLSEIAKAESNQLISNQKNISIENLVNDLAAIFKNKFARKNLTFKPNIGKDLSKNIDIDDQKLRYILSNILFFLTAQNTGGEIGITVSAASDSKIKFDISDNNNKGLPADLVKTFFEPFALSKLTEFKNSSLAGLSLTLVKKYVDFLGGEINVSCSSNGTLFTFTINGEVMMDLENTLSKLPKTTSKNKVLVIEDDYATSKLLSNYLNKWGYDPTIVSSEEQAFSVINSEKLLAVILDIEIPHINGLELLKKIHDNPNAKNVPVIACSIEPEQQKAFMMGAVEYFVKPINYNYLVEVLQHYKLRKDSNVLCVDDDVPTLKLVKQAIESVGFNAIAENVSANVMSLIRDKEIDLAIIDLDMPAPNGFELIKLIKSEKRFVNLPIIIYTGKENYREDLSKIEGLFEELLEKRSTNIEDLADTINAMINRYEVPPPVEEVIKKKGGIKILLAEDYKHSQIIVTRLLKKNNYEDIVVVENGEDAVKMATGDKFDLILMDMQMPVMNGFEATEKIREMPEYKNIPIIALTAFAMKGDREKCLESGATDYIPKPIDSKEFIDKVKYYTYA